MSKTEVTAGVELWQIDSSNISSHYPDAVIAFSGGVDSAVVAAACYRALGDRAVAITGVGPAVADSELEDAHNRFPNRSGSYRITDSRNR